MRPTGQLQFWVEPAKSMANEFEELVEQVTPGSLGSGVSGVALCRERVAKLLFVISPVCNSYCRRCCCLPRNTLGTGRRRLSS